MAKFFPRPLLLLTACHILFFAWAELFLFVGLFSVAAVTKAEHVTAWSVIALGGLAIVAPIYVVLAFQLRCPSCRRRFLIEDMKQKHPAARKLPWIDHWATTSIDVVRWRKFTCMYCGQEFELKGK
jgi:hypothetical protein